MRDHGPPRKATGRGLELTPPPPSPTCMHQEYNTLDDVEFRDMERTLARGNGRSPGGLPHFGRIAAETVDRVYKVCAVKKKKTRARVNPLLLLYTCIFLNHIATPE